MNSPLRKKDSFFVVTVAVLIVVFLFPIEKNLGYHFDKYLLLLVVVLPLLAWPLFAFLNIFREKKPTLWQAGKFTEVGFLNTLVDWGVLNLLMFLTGVDSGGYYSVFKSISFLAALLNSYFFNKFWTFESKKKEVLNEATKFFIVSFIGFLVNVLIASFLVNIVKPQFGLSPKIWANIGAVAATLFSMVWDFAGYKFFVFKK